MSDLTKQLYGEADGAVDAWFVKNSRHASNAVAKLLSAAAIELNVTPLQIRDAWRTAIQAEFPKINWSGIDTLPTEKSRVLRDLAEYLDNKGIAKDERDELIAFAEANTDIPEPTLPE